MTLLLTAAATIPYVCRTHCPPTGGAGPTKKTTGPTPQVGEGRGDEAKQDQTGKATRPNKTTTHLTGKGGYHGVRGGEGVCGSPASYISYIYIYIHIHTYTCRRRFEILRFERAAHAALHAPWFSLFLYIALAAF